MLADAGKETAQARKPPRVRAERMNAAVSTATALDRRWLRPTAAWLVIPAAFWLVLFALAPLVFMMAMSTWTSTIFGTTATWTLDNYQRFFDEPLYLTVLLTTIRVALLTTALSLVISYPLAWFLAERQGRAKAIFVILVFLPFWTSYLIRTFVWLPILGRTGIINDLLLRAGLISEPIESLLYNEGTIYLGLVYVYTLFMTLPIYVSLDRLDRNLIDAAADLGATPVRIFWRIVLPLSLPGVISGCVMVFLLSAGAFVTPQLLGGPSAIMFGNLIASQFFNNNNWAFGATLSVVLIAVVLAFVLIAGRRIGLQRIFVGEGH
jgi:spermidine/putrescine transport system permease protein